MTTATRTRRPVWGVLLAACVLAAGLQTPARATSAHIHTEYRDPVNGRTTTRVTPFSYFTPVHIDVDGNPATGDQLIAPGADVRVTVRPEGVGPSVRVTVDRLDSGRPLPLSVTVVLPFGESSVFEFGYDARSSTAPASIQLAFATGGMLAPSIDASMNQSGAGPSIRLFGLLYDEGPGGSHQDPKMVSANLSPVPDLFTARLAGTMLTGGTGQLALGATPPTSLAMTGASLDGPVMTRLSLDVDQLPSSLSLEGAVDSVTGEDVLTYSASAPVDRIDIGYTERIPSRIRTQTVGTLLGMPTEVSIRSRDGSMRVEAAAPIGEVTFGTAHSGDPQRAGVPSWLPDSDYAYAVTAGDYQSLAFRIHGLKEASAGQGIPDEFAATLEADRVPFRAVFVEEGAHSVTFSIDRLPARIQITSDLSTRLSYAATHTVDRMDIVVHDPNGLGDGYTYLRAALDDLPSSLAVDFGGTGGAISIDTGGPPIGALELVMSGQDGMEVFPWDVHVTQDPWAGQQFPVEGVLLWDQPGVLPPMMSARMTGLTRAAASLEPAATAVSLRTIGRPRFMALVWSPDDRIFVELRGLAPEVDVSMTPFGGGQRITYAASRTEDFLWFDTAEHDGSSWTWATLQDPLPASLDIRVEVDAHNRVFFDASEHTFLDMASSSGSSVTGGWLRHLRVGSDGGGSSGWVELNTNNHNMHGDYRSGGTRLNVRDFLRASNRRVAWWNFIPIESSGSATCRDTTLTVGGTSISMDDLC